MENRVVALRSLLRKCGSPARKKLVMDAVTVSLKNLDIPATLLQICVHFTRSAGHISVQL